MGEIGHVLILGGGFAGSAAAEELARLTPDRQLCRITLVDRNNYLLFTPMLTEVAGGSIDTEDVAVPIRLLSPRIEFVQGRVIHADLSHRQVTVEVGDGQSVPPTTRTIEADHIVFALGSESNFHEIPGLEENAVTIKSVHEAAAIRDRALQLLERANVEPDRHERQSILSFVVGGGGFSGVETMAALNSFVRSASKRLGNIGESDIRLVLVHPGDEVLPEIDSSLGRYARMHLESQGVRVALKTEVTAATGQSVRLKSKLHGQEDLPCRLLVWAGGVKPAPVVETCGLKLGQHRGIVVDEYLRVPDDAGVWAIGDCAEIPRPGTSGTYAPTAQNATREGAHLARNIVAVAQGSAPERFAYHPVGELAVLGDRSGVANVYGLRITGILAWLMWRAVYLAKIPHMSNRLRVAINWLVDLAFGRDPVELQGF